MGFVLAPSEYKRDYNVVGNYTEEMALGLSRLKKISLDDAKKFVKRVVKDRDPSKIQATFTLRNKHGDRRIVTRSLLAYLDQVISMRLGMVPTMSTYYRPDVKASPITDDIKAGKARRKKVKKQAGLDKQAGDIINATIGKGVQNAIKILINSWSGASLSPHNPFFNKSTHPALTTMCRIATALATASIERFLAGKRYYHKPERVIEDILVTVRRMPAARFHQVVVDFNLHLPSVDEVMEMITRSTDYYWWDDSWTQKIRELVETLHPEERAYILYNGDLYHLVQYNTKMMFDFMEMGTKTEGLEHAEEDHTGRLDGDQALYLSYIMGPYIKGRPLWDARKEDPKIEQLARDVAQNILKTMHKYREVVDTLFCVKTPPIDVGRQDNAVRLTVPLGDTDSSIFSTKHISSKYVDVTGNKENRLGVVNFCIYMVNGIVTHALAMFSAQMGIIEENLDLICMKSEFSMPMVQLTQAGKTYHGAVSACEGLVYDELEFELKGARLHGGRNNQDMINELKAWMVRTKTEYTATGKKIDRGELVDMILDIEYDLAASLHRKENVYYQRMKIKTMEEYNRPNSDAWAIHRLWEHVFAPTYGKAPEPVYQAYKVPANFENGFEAWVAELPEQMQRGIAAWQAETERPKNKAPTYFIIPTELLERVGTPKEMATAVHLLKLARTTLDPHYLNLGSLGLNMEYEAERGKLLSDMIPQYEEVTLREEW